MPLLRLEVYIRCSPLINAPCLTDPPPPRIIRWHLEQCRVQSSFFFLIVKWVLTAWSRLSADVIAKSLKLNLTVNASELRFSDSLLQERPTLWSGIGGATSSTLRIGPYWMNPSSKPFPWRYTDSNIKEANDANVVDLDDNDQINIELWTSLGFAIVQITEVRNSQFLFSILLREQTMSLALLFHWGCYLSEINASL